MSVLDDADKITESAFRHKSVTVLIITILILYSIGVDFWHQLEINHPGFAQAGQINEIEQKMVTKEELAEELTPINRSLELLTCQSSEVQLDLARKDVTAYELISERTLEQSKQLITARNRVHDMELRRNRACGIRTSP